MKLKNIYTQLILSFIIFTLTPFFASADNLGQGNNFYVDPNFSSAGAYNYQVSATLLKVTGNAYYYVDNSWYNSQTDVQKQVILSTLNNLANEFDSNIYPNLTNVYGSEWNPSIAPNDKRIAILFYPMKDNARGYFRNIDEYEKTVAPGSNQKEIIYLNTDDLTSTLLKSFLAHEFTHIIEFNQKEKRTGTAEEIWLNELRAEYSPTLLGYDDPALDNNYLKERIKTFINKPYDSLTEWGGDASDYGAISIFGHYLVDQYGTKILSDSLKSNKIGIDSISEALKKQGSADTFSSAFTNWTIASYLNDCSQNRKYCYLNKNLTDIHVVPFSNYMPFSGESSLTIGQNLDNWSANWQKFSGAGKDLKLDFNGKGQAGVSATYIIWNYNGKYEIKNLDLDASGKGEIIISKLGIDNASVMLIPSIKDASSGVDDKTPYTYSIVASTSIEPVSSTSSDVSSGGTQDGSVKLPFSIDKPLNQMSKEELMSVLLKLIIYLLSQGKTIF